MFEKLENKTLSDVDRVFLDRAIELAQFGQSEVYPNPRVGALYVRDGQVLGEGFHQKCGEGHAEVNAAKGKDLKGSTLYVSLEPCSHYGKTPPCAQLAVDLKVKRVVYALPDPGHGGGGVAILKKAGIEVDGPHFCRESLSILEPFVKNLLKGKTYFTLKWAMTIDGKIATENGDSKWITNEASRKHVHRIRTEVDGIMVGARTLIKDEPQLDIRHGVEGSAPRPIVWDPKAITLEAQHWYSAQQHRKPLVLTLKENLSLDWPKGVELCDQEQIQEWEELMFKKGFHHVLIEGGAGLHGAFNRAGIADRSLVYIAPKILGGKDSLSAVTGENPRSMSEARELTYVKSMNFSGDIFNEFLNRIHYPLDSVTH